MSEQLVTPENVTTKDGKINLLDLNRQQMREFFKDLGEKPFRADQVIKGWTEALKMMPEGSTYELFIPSELGYGERGNQGIPPYSTLIFKVEVLKVKSNPAPAKSK